MKYLQVINDWYNTLDESTVQQNDIATVAQIVADPRLQQAPEGSPIKKTAKAAMANIDSRLKQSANLVSGTLNKLNARLAQIAQNASKPQTTI